MKLNNNYDKNNINFSANVLNTHLAGNPIDVAKSSPMTLPNSYYRNSVLVHRDNKITTPESIKNKSVTNLYSPKQLLFAYSNPAYVASMINENPNVKNILASKSVPVQINPANIRTISNTHLTTTTANALQIANKLGLSQADKRDLEMACVFHDFGKILIPQEIINKPASLTPQEKEVIDLHAELGYELLSSTGMNTRVLNLIKNHHMPQNNADVLGQILSVADIYSALREERSYKHELEEQDALSILDQKALNGEVSTEVVDALKASVISANVA